MTRLTRAWVRYGRERGRELGLSVPQLFLLDALRQQGVIPIHRWAHSVGASPSATTGLLDRLEAEGLIHRAHDALDRRQILVSLTPTGRRLADRLRSDFRRRWAEVSAGFSSRQLDQVRELLLRLACRLSPTEQGDDTEPSPPSVRRLTV